MRAPVRAALVVFALLVSGSARADYPSPYGSNSYYESHWCGSGLPYLDDKQCQKKFPSDFNRDWQCPNRWDEDRVPAWFQPDLPLSQVKVNTTLLADLPELEQVNLMVIVIVRTDSGPRYWYIGGPAYGTPYETWSSSKIFAMANAAGHMQTVCGSGLVDNTTGTHGSTPLGDLATVICSYDVTQGYTSNGLARYFHDVGGRDRIYNLIQTWLGRPGESLGGNYGQPAPPDLGFSFTSPTGGEACTIAKDVPSQVYPNSISALSMAELTRRLVLYRDIPRSFQWPNTTFNDSVTELYGAERSGLFPGLQWGGMSSDTAIFLQQALGLDSYVQQSFGRWRIFSKLGAGINDPNLSEIVSSTYACLPVYTQAGDAVVSNQGLEVIVTGRVSVAADPNLSLADQTLFNAFSAALKRILPLIPR